MPQASDELRAKFPGHDAEALEVLRKNFRDNKGCLSLKDPNYKPTEREWDAVDYLIHEWDYDYYHNTIPSQVCCENEEGFLNVHDEEQSCHVCTRFPEGAEL